MTKQETINRLREAERDATRLSDEVTRLKLELADYKCEGKYVRVADADRKIKQVKDECYQAVIRLTKLIR